MTKLEQVAQEITDALKWCISAQLRFGPAGDKTKVFHIPIVWDKGFTTQLGFEVFVGHSRRVDAKGMYPKATMDLVYRYIAAEGYEVDEATDGVTLTIAPILEVVPAAT